CQQHGNWSQLTF
nr:immunoglobulin light chain junction region [Macaca mulatta]